jgi:hypothetical protein
MKCGPGVQRVSGVAVVADAEDGLEQLVEDFVGFGVGREAAHVEGEDHARERHLDRDSGRELGPGP